jgi:hypothetical protein
MKSLMSEDSFVFPRIVAEFRIEQDQAFADEGGGMRRVPGGVDQIRAVTNTDQRAPRALMYR